MAIIHKPEKTTLHHIINLNELAKKIYDKEDIQNYQFDESINKHPLAKRPTTIRSKLAYKSILKNLKPTTKYLLPGEIVLFNYAEPKLKEELEYYDKTPLTLFFGITRTKDGVIREIGLNLHYYPPFARARILNHTFNTFRPLFEKNFNTHDGKPYAWISWERLKHIMNTNMHLAFGIKMYIPILRQSSYVIPTRLLSTAYFTEGHFSKATLAQIFHFWRQFR